MTARAAILTELLITNAVEREALQTMLAMEPTNEAKPTCGELIAKALASGPKSLVELEVALDCKQGTIRSALHEGQKKKRWRFHCGKWEAL